MGVGLQEEERGRATLGGPGGIEEEAHWCASLAVAPARRVDLVQFHVLLLLVDYDLHPVQLGEGFNLLQAWRLARVQPLQPFANKCRGSIAHRSELKIEIIVPALVEWFQPQLRIGPHVQDCRGLEEVFSPGFVVSVGAKAVEAAWEEAPEKRQKCGVAATVICEPNLVKLLPSRKNVHAPRRTGVPSRACGSARDDWVHRQHLVAGRRGAPHQVSPRGPTNWKMRATTISGVSSPSSTASDSSACSWLLLSPYFWLASTSSRCGRRENENGPSRAHASTGVSMLSPVTVLKMRI